MRKQPPTITSLIKSHRPAQARAGARANNRLSFQESWSLCRLFDIHSYHSDYLATFDFIEDLVIFTDLKNYKNAEFYQIKSRDDCKWKTSYLLAKSKMSPCMLDKLASNIARYSKNKISLFLVLNGDLEMNVTGSIVAPLEFELYDADPKEHKKIKSKLSSIKPQKYDAFAKSTKIVRTSLPLDEQAREHQIKGQLASFITTYFAGRSYQLIPIFECIKAEISRRSKYENEVANLTELKEKKGLTKDQLISFVATGVDKTEIDEWTNLKTNLQAEGINLKLLREIELGFADWSILRYSASPTLEKVSNKIKEEIKKQETSHTKLIDLIENVYNSIKDIDFVQSFSSGMLKALVGYEFQTKR